MVLPAITLEKINQHALKKLVISGLVLGFFFQILFITTYRTSLTCIGQKRHKNSLNNRPIKTITEHLIERTNHRTQCSKRTLVSLTERHTLVASWLCYWHFFQCFDVGSRHLLTATHQPPPPGPTRLHRFRPAVPDTHTDPSKRLAVRLQLLGKKKKSWSPVSTSFSTCQIQVAALGGRGGMVSVETAALLHLCASRGPSWCLFSQVERF